ncbi:MAG: hypothetical protein HY804_05785 [Nitrospinae bacterium]|nr:hypothetical protein [Nitrospinota bacterium]
MNRKELRRAYRRAGIDGRTPEGRAFRRAWWRLGECRLRRGPKQEAALLHAVAYQVKSGRAFGAYELVTVTRAFRKLNPSHDHHTVRNELERILDEVSR